MKTIEQKKIINPNVTVPGSKSYSHRIIIAAALSDGICELVNVLKSDDTRLTMGALRQMGIRIDEQEKLTVIHGLKGTLKACREPIYLGNSGTSMRLLTGVASIGQGSYTLAGTDRMQERPLTDLLAGLSQIGIVCNSVRGNGCPPVEIIGGKIEGGKVGLKCDISSQYLSALMLIAPYTDKGLDITITHGPVSKPYIDMTADIMQRFGVCLERDGYRFFSIPGRQCYRSGNYEVEPDCSQAGYFWAAAAVTGQTVKVLGISKDTRQGDAKFTQVLEAMGCKVTHERDGIAVTGQDLTGIDIDMADMPDLVPTLANVAAFAEGTTRITNVAHLKEKESDRLGAVAAELAKLGVDVKANDSGLVIEGHRPGAKPLKGAEIDTYDDHRIAMSFAVAGLVVRGIVIRDEMCVEKSFPNFWEVFGGMF